MNDMYSKIIHKWLKIPYTLHVVEYRSPKRPRQTVVFIHGLGNSAGSWREIARRLPVDVRVIAVDMLGFGESPKPKWVRYDIAVQAKAVAHTLLKLGLLQKPILVGHSMGSLVAIELAKRFPLVVKQLLLCSPPLYKSTAGEWEGYEKVLKEFYRVVIKHPGELQQIAPIAKKLGITSPVFDVRGQKARVYVAALESSIINQSSLDDIRKLDLPITILHGTFDPVVIGSHLKDLDRSRRNIVMKQLPVGHEIIGRYRGYVIDELLEILKTQDNH